MTKFFLFFSFIGLVSISYAQTVSTDFDWANQTEWTNVSTNSDLGCGTLTVTTVGENHKGSSPNGISIGGFGLGNDQTTPNNNLVVQVTITFSQPVSNVRLLLSDLDFFQGINVESLSDFNIFPTGIEANPVTGVVEFYQGTLPFPGSPPAIFGSVADAVGWLVWDGVATNQISFNYNRNDARLGISLFELEYDCNVNCCPDERSNLVINGDFESGNNGFSSQYTFSDIPTISPGSYGVLNVDQATKVCENWLVSDPICTGDGSFLIANGQTNQPVGTSTLLWAQTLGSLEGGEYVLCFDAKNLPSCCFDILPILLIEIGNQQFQVEVSAESGDCDWMSISLPYELLYSPSSLTINISILEDGLGDGNDVALDNIQFGLKPQMDLGATILATSGAATGVVGSIWDITPFDDQIGDGCQFQWSINGITNPDWGLTTDFPGHYWLENQLYAITLAVDDCDCLDDDSITINVEFVNKKFIIYGDNKGGKSKSSNSKITIRPNPAKDIVFIEGLVGTSLITLYNSRGVEIRTEKIENEFRVDMLPKGAYYVKIQNNESVEIKTLTIQ